MKALMITLLVMASSAHASALMEDITCVGRDKTLTLKISTVNRPDFDLGKFDSADQANNDGISFYPEKNGKTINMRLITLDSIDGKTTPIMDTGRDGKPCQAGSKDSGIQVAARLTVNGVDSLDVLRCTDNLQMPHGGECN